MSDISLMDIEDGLTLNADTGAIALLEKSVQIRENYPEVDSDDSNPTKATSSKIGPPLIPNQP